MKNAKPGIKRRAKRTPKKSYILDLSTVGGRLTNARIAAGFLEQQQFAAANGLPASTYGQWETNRRALPPDRAVELSKILNLTLDYLYKGNPLPKEGTSVAAPLAGEPHPVLNLGDIAALDAIASGERPKNMEDNVIVLPPRNGVNERERLFVHIDDDAMQAPNGPQTFSEGDDVELDTSKPIRPGCYVLAIVEGKRAVLRRLRVIDEGRIELHPLNPDWPIIRVDDPTKVKLVARAVRRLTAV